MAFLSGQKLGTELCRALGLDPQMVIGINLDCRLNDVARATVEMFVTDESGDLVKAVKHYELRELAG